MFKNEKYHHFGIHVCRVHMCKKGLIHKTKEQRMRMFIKMVSRPEKSMKRNGNTLSND